jgi:hypothetical protein
MEKAGDGGRCLWKKVVNKCEIVEVRTVSKQCLLVLRPRRRRRRSDGDDVGIG